MIKLEYVLEYTILIFLLSKRSQYTAILKIWVRELLYHFYFKINSSNLPPIFIFIHNHWYDQYR